MRRGIFGRKKMEPSRGNYPALPSIKYGETVRLKIDEVRQYCFALAAQRGYPEDSFGMIADRVGFLERRGLPGFEALILDLTTFKNETLAERFSIVRPNGVKGGHCPFVAGVQLDDKLDEFTSGDPYTSNVIIAPSAAMLLIPKVASFAGPMGRLVSITWYRDDQEALKTVLDGYRIAHNGDLTALANATEIGFARYPEEEYPIPPIQAGQFNDIEVSAERMLAIQDLLDE